jgi:hypothetical protein
MWLITKDGFFSVVHKDCAPDEVLVRARVKKDLVALAGTIDVECDISQSYKTDYQFRMVMPRADFCRYLVKYAEEMVYDNFKNSLNRKDYHRRSVYSDIWADGMRLDERFKK